jgi:hypothetical protein
VPDEYVEHPEFMGCHETALKLSELWNAVYFNGDTADGAGEPTFGSNEKPSSGFVLIRNGKRYMVSVSYSDTLEEL